VTYMEPFLCGQPPRYLKPVHQATHPCLPLVHSLRVMMLILLFFFFFDNIFFLNRHVIIIHVWGKNNLIAVQNAGGIVESARCIRAPEQAQTVTAFLLDVC
jgi:hypothetical protein